MVKDWQEMEQAWSNPGEQGENLQFHDFPAYHMMNLASLVKLSGTREYLEPAGLSVPEWRLLSAVADSSPIPFGQIPGLTMMDKGQVSRTLRTAQSKGFIETEMVPPERRPGEPGAPAVGRLLVHVTQAGREIYESVMPLAQRYQLKLLELMSHEERRLMIDLGRRLYELLHGDPQRQP